MAYRARFAQAGHVTDTPGPSGVPGSRTPVQPPGVRTGAFTRPVHAHMHMYMCMCMHMYMRSQPDGPRRADAAREARAPGDGGGNVARKARGALAAAAYDGAVAATVAATAPDPATAPNP